MCLLCANARLGSTYSSLAHEPVGFWPFETEVSDYSALLSGQSWVTPDGDSAKARPTFITYSFQKTMTSTDETVWTGNPAQWRPFSEQDKKDARAALRQWGDASGITFLETNDDHGDLQFSWTPQENTYGFAYLPLSEGVYQRGEYVSSYLDLSGNVYLDTGTSGRFANDPAFKKYTLLHEIGHALGLKHPFDAKFYNNKVLTAEFDRVSQTVMAYKSDSEASPTQLGPLDIQAIQALYGSQNVDGRQVHKWSWNAKLEILTQKGKASADVLWGTSVTDVINGQKGNDRLHGMAGDDVLIGGKGRDKLIGGSGKDAFRFTIDPNIQKGADTVFDFDAAVDRIELLSGAFSQAGLRGVLTASAFANGFGASDADDRIIYEGQSSGAVYYDPDGTGPLAQIMIARLTATDWDFWEEGDTRPALTASHFFIV